MNILWLHRYPYYGKGLRDTLTECFKDLVVEHYPFAKTFDYDSYNVILADAESLRLICRSLESVLYDSIKIILLKSSHNKDIENYISPSAYDSYIKNDASPEEIYREIRAVMSIKSTKMLRQRRRHDRLSAREYQIALCLLENYRNKDIALAMGLNEKTVSTYKARLFKKFKIKSLLELHRAMVEARLL